MGNIHHTQANKVHTYRRCSPFILSISHCTLVHNLLVFTLTNVYPSITTLQPHSVVRKWYFHKTIFVKHLGRVQSLKSSLLSFLYLRTQVPVPYCLMLFKKRKRIRTIPSGSAIDGAQVLPDAVCSPGRKRTSAVLSVSSRKSVNLLLWLKMDAPNCVGCWFKITSAVYITSDLFYLLAHYGYE